MYSPLHCCEGRCSIFMLAWYACSVGICLVRMRLSCLFTLFKLEAYSTWAVGLCFYCQWEAYFSAILLMSQISGRIRMLFSYDFNSSSFTFLKVLLLDCLHGLFILIHTAVHVVFDIFRRKTLSCFAFYQEIVIFTLLTPDRVQVSHLPSIQAPDMLYSKWISWSIQRS